MCIDRSREVGANARPGPHEPSTTVEHWTLTAFSRKRSSPDRWKALRSPPRIRIVLSNRLTSTFF